MYRPNEPGQARELSTSGSPDSGQGQLRSKRYSTLLKEKDTTRAKRYSVNDSYAPGDVLEHPSFGIGVTTALKGDTKIEVLFGEGSKLLVHRQ
jgi:hypothetical protein